MAQQQSPPPQGRQRHGAAGHSHSHSHGLGGQGQVQQLTARTPIAGAMDEEDSSSAGHSLVLHPPPPAGPPFAVAPAMAAPAASAAPRQSLAARRLVPVAAGKDDEGGKEDEDNNDDDDEEEKGQEEEDEEPAAEEGEEEGEEEEGEDEGEEEGEDSADIKVVKIASQSATLQPFVFKGVLHSLVKVATTAGTGIEEVTDKHALRKDVQEAVRTHCGVSVNPGKNVRIFVVTAAGHHPKGRRQLLGVGMHSRRGLVIFACELDGEGHGKGKTQLFPVVAPPDDGHPWITPKCNPGLEKVTNFCAYGLPGRIFGELVRFVRDSLVAHGATLPAIVVQATEEFKEECAARKLRFSGLHEVVPAPRSKKRERSRKKAADDDDGDGGGGGSNGSDEPKKKQQHKRSREDNDDDEDDDDDAVVVVAKKKAAAGPAKGGGGGGSGGGGGGRGMAVGTAVGKAVRDAPKEKQQQIEIIMQVLEDMEMKKRAGGGGGEAELQNGAWPKGRGMVADDAVSQSRGSGGGGGGGAAGAGGGYRGGGGNIRQPLRQRPRVDEFAFEIDDDDAKTVVNFGRDDVAPTTVRTEREERAYNEGFQNGVTKGLQIGRAVADAMSGGAKLVAVPNRGGGGGGGGHFLSHRGRQ